MAADHLDKTSYAFTVCVSTHGFLYVLLNLDGVETWQPLIKLSDDQLETFITFTDGIVFDHNRFN
jgi:hypothetical protein